LPRVFNVYDETVAGLHVKSRLVRVNISPILVFTGFARGIDNAASLNKSANQRYKAEERKYRRENGPFTSGFSPSGGYVMSGKVAVLGNSQAACGPFLVGVAFLSRG